MENYIMLEFWHEFLPSQYENYKHFVKDDIGPVYNKCLFDLLSEFNGLSDYDDLVLKVPEHFPIPTMVSNPITIKFLQFLIRLTKAHQVLEIGTYIGISAIKMAQAMPSSGYLITIEKGKQFFELAKANIKNNPTECYISTNYGDALELVSDWQLNPFNQEDLIYLDADKPNYDKYLEPLLSILRPGGLLVIDDALFHGDVLNNVPVTDHGRGVKKLLKKATALNCPKVLLPLSNGVLLIQAS
jgi:caffeoyl-CoA O-methyltransferase